MREKVYEKHPYGDTYVTEEIVFFYCDECGEEDQLYDYDGQELCIECIKAKLDKIN